MISPYVRRRRLAAELLRLRTAQSLTAKQLADAVGVKRQSISRLENHHGPADLDLVFRILDRLGVSQERWSQIVAIARDAAERGWWERYAAAMGARQALYADLEAGAASIREYQMTFLPGLLQIPPFTEARIRTDQKVFGQRFDADKALQARRMRQRIIERPGGPTYEVIIDELAIRRLAAPVDIMRIQLDHIIELGHQQPHVSVRVLPLAAPIDDFAVPRSAFSIYQYPDPDDDIVVAVDTVTSDLVLTDEGDLAHYLPLYERLILAALEPSDSLDFLASVAEDLHPERIGRDAVRNEFVDHLEPQQRRGQLRRSPAR